MIQVNIFSKLQLPPESCKQANCRRYQIAIDIDSDLLTTEYNLILAINIIKRMINLMRKHTIGRYSTFVCLLIILISGCSNTYDYAKDEPFVTASFSPAGPDDFRNLISNKIAIYQDGTLILSADGNSDINMGTDKPELELQLDEEQIKLLQELIEDEKFGNLPNDVTAPSEDGAFYNITVNLTNESKEVNGLNPDNESFHKIHKHIFNLVDDEKYANWKNEVDEYVWDQNTLHTNEKNEYKENGPFLNVILEKDTSSFPEPLLYYYNLDLDIDGNLVYSVLDEEDKKVNDAPKLEVQLKKEELDDIQKIIEDNFWKLKNRISSGDGSQTESISIYLTEEDKTVEGDAPDHPRFIKIRDSILNSVDENDYKEWEEDVKEYMFDKNDIEL